MTNGQNNKIRTIADRQPQATCCLGQAQEPVAPVGDQPDDEQRDVLGEKGKLEVHGSKGSSHRTPQAHQKACDPQEHRKERDHAVAWKASVHRGRAGRDRATSRHATYTTEKMSRVSTNHSGPEPITASKYLRPGK